MEKMMRISTLRCLFLLLSLCASTAVSAQSSEKTGSVWGIVKDEMTELPLIGATLSLDGTMIGDLADPRGIFHIENLEPGFYTLRCEYLSYATSDITVEVRPGRVTEMAFMLSPEAVEMDQVVVVGQRRQDTEVALLDHIKSSRQVVSGISSEQISKTLDKDASEAVRRVPGITVMDDRFIVVRGLNSRYNNVWLNGASAPSSETDVKAFAFDAIPSNMIDHILVYKTSAPELPGEATGGFVKVTTRNMPLEKYLQVDYSIAYDDAVTFKKISLDKSVPADKTGFNSGYRDIPGSFPSDLNNLPAAEQTRHALTLNNDWSPARVTALPNQKITLQGGGRWNIGNVVLGNTTSLSYGNTYQAKVGQNYSYDSYNANGPSGKLYDVQEYNYRVNFGALFNWALSFGEGQRIEFKNLLDQVSTNRTNRMEGWNNYRMGYFNYDMLGYTLRTTYSGQFSGFHPIGPDRRTKIDWNAGFSYANKREPDRRIYGMKRDEESGRFTYLIPSTPSVNEFGRLWLRNKENLTAGAINVTHLFDGDRVKPTLKAGLYGEYKTRDYSERSFGYRSTNRGLTAEELSQYPLEELFSDTYFGRDKSFYLEEQTNPANFYDAKNIQGAAYVALDLEIGAFDLYFGVRGEYNRLELNGYYDANTPVEVDDPRFNLFPSVNMSYKAGERSLLRLAYGRTVNRPEFREVSPLQYYDFSELATYKGNPELKEALIDNVDLRYEFYPQAGDVISVAVFYKHFKNPIEMVAFGGSGSNYTFDNASKAYSCGVELEIRKSLEFIGLRNFSLIANAAWIESRVSFDEEAKATEQNRPLQGQSPYIVNAGLFYESERLGLSGSLMYNVIGKRILVAAEVNQGREVLPSIYEMPRNVLNFTLSKRIGRYVELKMGIKDILAQRYRTLQTFRYDGTEEDVDGKSFRMGRTISLGVALKF